MKKVFRIVRNNLSKEAEESFHPYRYRIEVRHTILFFIHWWSAPEFEPPHNFEHTSEAYNCIKEHCPNSIVYSLFVQSSWKPNDEQMEALHDLNLTGNISYAGQGQILIELYNDLKKLTE